jgi:hypothetical protein
MEAKSMKCNCPRKGFYCIKKKGMCYSDCYGADSDECTKFCKNGGSECGYISWKQRA